MAGFLIYALPRSRTAWLSHFLSYAPWKCYHDIAIDLHSISDLQRFFSQPYTGTAETGMIDGWKLVKKLIPDTRIVIVRRPIEEVSVSLGKFGIDANADLEHRNKNLDEASANLNALIINFDDLNNESTCKHIFEYCLGIEFDRDWWVALKDVNIQVDMSIRLMKLAENRDGIDRLKSEARHLMEAA